LLGLILCRLTPLVAELYNVLAFHLTLAFAAKPALEK
jgi:hypothetical protein